MGTNASVVETRGISYEAERRRDRTGSDPRNAVREILTDPALIRIACLAVGISVLFLAIAAAL